MLERNDGPQKQRVQDCNSQLHMRRTPDQTFSTFSAGLSPSSLTELNNLNKSQCHTNTSFTSTLQNPLLLTLCSRHLKLQQPPGQSHVYFEQAAEGTEKNLYPHRPQAA